MICVDLKGLMLWFCTSICNGGHLVNENSEQRSSSRTSMPSFRTTPSSAPIRSPMNLELVSIKKSIKREASAYSVLKDECFFDKFQRDLLITAKSHDVSEILDPSYSPGPYQRKGNYLKPSTFSCIKSSMKLYRQIWEEPWSESTWGQLMPKLCGKNTLTT